MKKMKNMKRRSSSSSSRSSSSIRREQEEQDNSSSSSSSSSNGVLHHRLKILSWNTLEASGGGDGDGAFSTEWGCPLEIHRRDALLLDDDGVADGWNAVEAEKQLTMERFSRIRHSVWENDLRPHHHDNDNDNDNDNDIHDIDLALFQGITPNHRWYDNNNHHNNNNNDNNNDNDDDNLNFRDKIVSGGYAFVPCKDSVDAATRVDDSVQAMLYRKDRYNLDSSVLLDDNFPGCLAHFTTTTTPTTTPIDEKNSNNQAFSFWIANIHAVADVVQNPRHRVRAVQDFVLLIDEMIADFTTTNKNNNNNNNDEVILLCGDWNVHLPDMKDLFISATNKKYTTAAVLSSKNTTGNAFTTNHQNGFVAQYDGCLVITSYPQQQQQQQQQQALLVVDKVERNTNGFMPKGRNGNLPETFQNVYTEGVYYNHTLLSGSEASNSMSDHTRITTELLLPLLSSFSTSASATTSGVLSQLSLRQALDGFTIHDSILVSVFTLMAMTGLFVLLRLLRRYRRRLQYYDDIRKIDTLQLFDLEDDTDDNYDYQDNVVVLHDINNNNIDNNMRGEEEEEAQEMIMA